MQATLERPGALAMTDTPHNRRAADRRRDPDDGTLGIVLRAVALAALALGLGMAASLLVDARHAESPGASTGAGR